MEFLRALPVEVIEFVGLVGLVFLRVISLAAMTPIFGGESAPRRFKTAIALLLAFVLAGLAYRGGEPRLTESWGTYGQHAIFEALIGVVLAIFVRILFDFVSGVGSLVDLARGSTQSLVYDPFARSQQSPLALFQLSLVLALFFSLGGHRWILSALGDSLESAPVGGGFPEQYLGSAAVTTMIGLVSDLFVAALQLAAPVIVTLFFVDMMLGLTNRVAEQVQVFFLGMTVKGLIGLGVFMLTLGYTLDIVVAGSFERIAAFFGG